MRFDDSRSPAYNYEVGYLEGLQLALRSTMFSTNIAVELRSHIEVQRNQVLEQLEMDKEMK